MDSELTLVQKNDSNKKTFDDIVYKKPVTDQLGLCVFNTLKCLTTLLYVRGKKIVHNQIKIQRPFYF